MCFGTCIRHPGTRNCHVLLHFLLVSSHVGSTLKTSGDDSTQIIIFFCVTYFLFGFVCNLAADLDISSKISVVKYVKGAYIGHRTNHHYSMESYLKRNMATLLGSEGLICSISSLCNIVEMLHNEQRCCKICYTHGQNQKATGDVNWYLHVLYWMSVQIHDFEFVCDCKTALQDLRNVEFSGCMERMQELESYAVQLCVENGDKRFNIWKLTFSEEKPFQCILVQVNNDNKCMILMIVLKIVDRQLSESELYIYCKLTSCCNC